MKLQRFNGEEKETSLEDQNKAEAHSVSFSPKQGRTRPFSSLLTDCHYWIFMM
ncbi:hypothetical protein L345_15108 [Ophiophagus hannah]|uniref:Uncharacterized protein n=1 Tax=Ophiophagus hannah TaxID=8665 RepID=V8NBZ4_OPHHA|nr:hypothetical protein L345_15108 [Ophiophagus hannah]